MRKKGESVFSHLHPDINDNNRLQSAMKLYFYRNSLAMNKQCLACEKPLKGRSDKKFCDDQCRNNYNNKQYGEKTGLIRNINRILSKNRRILEGFLANGEDMKKTTRPKLSDAGYNFKYFTHQYQNTKGQVYCFVYEYGYLPLDGDWMLIVKRK